MTKKTEKKVLDLKKQIKDWQERCQRALADYQNLKKRTEREREEYLKFANTALIAEFLEVLDSLEEAAEHLKDEGLNLVLSQFRDVLASEGVREIKAKGEKFDPKIHECVEVVKVDDKKMVNQVVEEVRKGYWYQNGGRVIRHAQVKVGKEDIPPETKLAERGARAGDYA